MAGKKKSNGVSITALLIVIVVTLSLCVGIMAWLLLGGTRKSSRDAQEGNEQQLENGVQYSTENESESETLSETETETDALTETETVSEPAVQTEPVRMLTVAIDPGHQGSNINMSDPEPMAPGSSEMKARATTGTQSPYTGFPEYQLNLDVSLQLRTELEARGYRVIMTRENNDTAISNSERALKAADEGGDIYVRIHANGSDDHSVNGALAMVPSPENPYVSELAADSYLLGDCILNAYCAKTPFQNDGIQYHDDMTGINWSQLPVMILEMGYMSNQSDDQLMCDPSVQKSMVEGIADGIDQYFDAKGLSTTQSAGASQTGNSAITDISELTTTPLNDASVELSILTEEIRATELAPAQSQGEVWTVGVCDLNTGAMDDIDGDTQMKSASVIKLFIMATIYDRVCYPASEDRRLTISESYDGELKQLITDMITVSDNDASNTLVTRLGGGDFYSGMEIVNQFCKENGYTGTSLGRKFLDPNPQGDNYTTANDCTRLLQSIYTGTCVNAEASAKMYEYMKNQTRTGKIPAGIAGLGATTANKTGELGGEFGDYVENDVAIVEKNGKAYVLSIINGQLKDNGSAVSRINRISKMTYDMLIGE